MGASVSRLRRVLLEGKCTNSPKDEDDRDLAHRYVDVSVSNSSGADACPERRVAPRLGADQDTKEEHQPRQPDERW